MSTNIYTNYAKQLILDDQIVIIDKLFLKCKIIFIFILNSINLFTITLCVQLIYMKIRNV